MATNSDALYLPKGFAQNLDRSPSVTTMKRRVNAPENFKPVIQLNLFETKNHILKSAKGFRLFAVYHPSERNKGQDTSCCPSPEYVSCLPRNIFILSHQQKKKPNAFAMT